MIIGIQTFPAGSSALLRHWPYFERSGADALVCITTNDGRCEIPPGAAQTMIGRDVYIMGAELPRRLLNTFRFLLSTGHEWLGVAEYDVVFCRPISELQPGLTTHLAGGQPQGCRCHAFYHGPWICDRDTAQRLVEAGQAIMDERICDSSPDCALGQWAERAGVPVHTDILKSYSRNTIHGPTWIEEARQARINGAVSIHGVKHADVLTEIFRD